MSTHINDIPPEVLTIIFNMVDNGFIISTTCHRWKLFVPLKRNPKALCMEKSIERGYLSIVKWLYKMLPHIRSWCNTAARNGQIEILKWLREHESPWDNTTCTIAAANGQLATLKRLRDPYKYNWHSDVCDWSRDTAINAAKNGHLKVLKWLWENNCPGVLSSRLCIRAAERGHLDIIKWLVKIGIDISINSVYRAASRAGHLKIIKWLVKNRYPWARGICEQAALNGHLDIIKWVRDNGCPWDVDTVRDNALRSGSMNIIEWLDV